MDEFEFTLDYPLTEEQWDMLEDVDFDHTDNITFHTKHGKEVRFVKDKDVRSNGDYIRSMSDEDLAVWISALYTTQQYAKADPRTWRDWLQQDKTP